MIAGGVAIRIMAAKMTTPTVGAAVIGETRGEGAPSMRLVAVELSIKAAGTDTGRSPFSVNLLASIDGYKEFFLNRLSRSAEVSTSGITILFRLPHQSVILAG